MTKTTKIIHSGRDPKKYSGNINVPIYQTSTINFDNLADLEKAKVSYGRHGTDTVFELSKLVSEIEHAHETFLLPCGMSAITTAILSFVRNGDHILVSNAVYEPTKIFVEKFLTRYGVEHSYYEAGNVDTIKQNYQENTKLIFSESPGSIFFIIDDLDEVVAFAKEKNITTLIDNTWSAGRLLNPLDIGFDVSLQSATKYFCGHSDAMLGTVSAANPKVARKIADTYRLLGARVSPNDCSLVARGIRTLDLRLKEHSQAALQVAQFLEEQEVIDKVYYPPLESHPYHHLFKKYYANGNGILSFNFKDHISHDAIRKFVDDLTLFGIGYSWGGYESLIMLYTEITGVDLADCNNHIIRINIGLENVSDLLDDLKASLSNLA